MTRCRLETATIGSSGQIISSTVDPQVQAVFPEGALMKTIKVGLQVSNVRGVRCCGDCRRFTPTEANNVPFSIVLSVARKLNKFALGEASCLLTLALLRDCKEINGDRN